MCNIFTLIPLQDMTLVQLIDNSRVYGRIDTLNGSGSEMGFELLEELPSITLSLCQIKKKEFQNFFEVSEILL